MCFPSQNSFKSNVSCDVNNVINNSSCRSFGHSTDFKELTVSTRGEETAHPQTTVILTMAAMSGPRIFVGKESHPVTTPAVRSRGPVTPVENGDGTIFVSIPSYRGTFWIVESIAVLVHANLSNQDLCVFS